MARPLMQHGIGQLEQMFATMTGDTKVLKQLENELSYRQVPRAYALAEKVAMALRTGAPVTAGPPAAAPQLHRDAEDLFADQSVPVSVVLRPKSLPDSPPLAHPREPRAALPLEPQPAVGLDEAFKLLNVTPATSWEQVEQARQRLVNHAHPALLAKLSPERQTQATRDARRVNAAYAVLATRRLESRLDS